MLRTRNLTQLSRSVAHCPSTSVGLAVLVLVLVVLGLTTEASADEEIYVLTAGGTAQLETEVVRTPPDGLPHLQSGAPKVLELTTGGLATYSDLVVLPGRHLLLADGSGRGGVVFDEEGIQTDELFAQGELSPPSSLVAAAFVDPNHPDLYLMGDDTVGRILVYDAVDETYIWHFSTTRSGVRGQIGRATVLPEDRFAVAVSWPALDLSAIIVVPWEPSPQPEFAIFSRNDAASPGDPVIEGLHPVRDLMTDLDGRMLITSQNQLTISDSAGEILWTLNIGDDPQLGGQFQSARWTDSGLVVAATREPGLWNQPHLNHRLHLIDPELETPLLDTSGSFEAAPLRIDSARGIGATGTRDYFADAFEFETGSLRDLIVTDGGPHLSPPEIHLDESATLSFAIFNEGEEAVSIRRVDFRTARGRCEELDLPGGLHLPWWSDGSPPRLEPGQTYQVDQLVLQAQALAPDQWCGQLIATARDGSSEALGQALDFEILPPVDADNAVSIDVLAEFDGQDVGIGPGFDGDDELENGGCSCRSSAAAPSPLSLVFLALALVYFFRVRRRDRPARPCGLAATRRERPPLPPSPGARRAR